MQKITVFWFRRDLRLHDNAGLYAALDSSLRVLPVFIFDSDILNQFNPDDQRVTFIYQSVLKLKRKLENLGSSLKVYYGRPTDVFKHIVAEYQVAAVYTNHDYESYAIGRDHKIEEFLRAEDIVFKTRKDHVIFEKNEILKDNGIPYKVFSPYCKKWKSKVSKESVGGFPSEKISANFFKSKPYKVPSLESMRFHENIPGIAPLTIDLNIIRNYKITRDFPAVNGTSRLGVYLRFGLVSIRELTRIAIETSEVFLNELIWRNFFIDILWHYPFVEHESFKKQYRFIKWRNNEEEFELWCKGETGYPMVDAGMRELNATGFMHNRVRMVTASFLVKHLLIDWRWGEAYFAGKLLDYELASNNGNWQWAAGTGCDSAPYFRIFNPANQQLKFDRQNEYIKKWVPELNDKKYPSTIVGHRFARERVLAAYKKALIIK
jgi:deoxyribodipyrimidine photo-lyase